MPTKPHIAILMEFPTALGGERSLLSILGLLKDKYEITLLAPTQGPLADLIKLAEVKHLQFSVRNLQGIRKSDEELLSELHLLLHAESFQSCMRILFLWLGFLVAIVIDFRRR